MNATLMGIHPTIMRGASRICLIVASVVFVAFGTARASTSVLYDNGTNGGFPTFFTGLAIDSEHAVTDSFNITSTSTVTEIDIWTVGFPGSTPLTLDWGITTQALGGTTLASGTADLNYTFTFDGSTGGGCCYDVGEDTFSVPNVVLGSGTYWLQIQNASDIPGSPCCSDVNPPSVLYWDSGQPAGPSQAYQENLPPFAPNLTSQPSEAFEILGTTTAPATIPEPATLLVTAAGLAAVLVRRYLRRVRA